MPKRLLLALLINSVLISGCATAPKQDHASLQSDNISLNDWVSHVAIPYLVKELGEHPRFKGEPFLLVSMEQEDVAPNIDELTSELREQFIDGLLAKPGIALIWRPSAASWKHHTGLENIECHETVQEHYYIGIDTAISQLSGKLEVRIRAFDLRDMTWVTGFGITWQGVPTSAQKDTLTRTHPDEYLLGLRPNPFREQQADLLAAYLAKNLSCLFADLEQDETKVYVGGRQIQNSSYFANAFEMMKNYLAKFRKVTITEDQSKADVILLAEVHGIHPGLYQVWVNSRNTRDETYIPGRVTEAYVALSGTTEPLVGDPFEVPEKSITGARYQPQADFNLCFYNYQEGFEQRIYPMLKTHPDFVGIQQFFDQCENPDLCVCYSCEMNSITGQSTAELALWLDQTLKQEGNRYFKLLPKSNSDIEIVFDRGFE